MVSRHHFTIIGGHWSSASGDIKYLICPVNNININISTLPSLLVIAIAVVDICF